MELYKELDEKWRQELKKHGNEPYSWHPGTQEEHDAAMKKLQDNPNYWKDQRESQRYDPRYDNARQATSDRMSAQHERRREHNDYLSLFSEGEDNWYED